MAPSPNSESWKLFAVLLAVSTAVTFVLSVVSDALALRRAGRRAPVVGAVGAVGASRQPDRMPVHQ